MYTFIARFCGGLAVFAAAGAMFFSLLQDTPVVADDQGNDSAVASGKSIAFGPYVQNVTHEQAVVSWLTLARESTVTDPDGERRTVPHYEVHELFMPDLAPNTRYEYDVLGDGSEVGSGWFVTFPEEHHPYRFVVAGDTRSNHDIHQKIVDRILAEDRCSSSTPATWSATAATSTTGKNSFVSTRL